MRLAFDSDNRILLLSAQAVTDQLLLEAYDLVNRCWDKLGAIACIADYTEVVEIQLSSETVETIAERRPIVPPICYSVIVAPQDALYKLWGMVQIASAETRPTLQVVRTIDDAFKLIGVSSATFTPLDDFPEAA